METVLFLTIGNAVNVQLPDIGKQNIYRRKDQANSTANFGNYWSPGKNIVAELPKL